VQWLVCWLVFLYGFDQQFASVFTEEDMDNLPDLGINPTPEMNKITINTEGAQNRVMMVE
jgi:hypothetical protein